MLPSLPYGSDISDYGHPRMDRITFAQYVLEYEHHEIHGGSHFQYTDSVELGAASQDYVVQTPDSTTWAHMVFEADASAIGQVRVYEGTDKGGVTLQTNVINNNRNSSNAPAVSIYKGTTGGSVDGDLIYTYKGGAATNQSKGESGTRNSNEIILKQGTKYIFRLTAFAASTLCNLKLSWYEHINRPR